MSDDQFDEREAAEARALAEAIEDNSNSAEQADQPQGVQTPEDALQSAELLRYVRDRELSEERAARVLESLADVPIPPAPVFKGAQVLRPRFRKLVGISSVAAAAAALLLTWRLQTHEAFEQVASKVSPTSSTALGAKPAPRGAAPPAEEAPLADEELAQAEDSIGMARSESAAPAPASAAPTDSRARARAAAPSPSIGASDAPAMAAGGAKPTVAAITDKSPYEADNPELPLPPASLLMSQAGLAHGDALSSYESDLREYRERMLKRLRVLYPPKFGMLDLPAHREVRR